MEEDEGKIVRAALGRLTQKRGKQTELSKATGASTSLVNRIISGGSQGKKYWRLFAAKLGFPGRRYEDFLDIGRRIIAEEQGESQLGPPATDRQIEDGWPMSEHEDEKNGYASVWRALVQSKDDLIAEKERTIARLEREVEETKRDNECLKNLLETKLRAPQ